MEIKLKNVLSYFRKELLIIIMRTFIFLCCITAFGFTPSDVLSQNAKVKIDVDNTLTVDEVFDLIMEQTDYKFIYQEGIFENFPKVKVKKGTISANKLLQKSLSSGNFTVVLSSDNTVLVKESTLEIIKQQGVQISGSVLDTNGQPLPGANVIEKGTSNGAQTDFDGKFSLNVNNENAILVVSYIGFLTKEVAVNNQTSITITLQEDAAKLDEVVVVGYGTQSKVKVTNAISSISDEAIERLPVASFEESLAGQMSGVQVVEGSGSPGSDAQITIRGTGTITAGSNPLIVVDGFPLSEGSSLSSINSNDIATIDVLKDAASAAIYGSRGSNGVILVTTKKGKLGKNKVTANIYTGFQQVIQNVELMDAYQFSEFVKEGRDNYYVGLNPGVNSASDANNIRAINAPGDKKALIPSYIVPYLDGTPGLTNTNWLDEIFRSAPISSIDLSASGANEKTKYYVSGNYFQQDGVMIGTDYERITARINLETKLSDKFTFGINVTPSYSKQNKVPEQWGDSPLTHALNMFPTTSVYNPDGSYNLSTQILDGLIYDTAQSENPLAVADNTTDNVERFRIIASSFLNFEIIKGLNYKVQFGYDFDNSRAKYFRPSFIGAYRDPLPTTTRGSETSITRRNVLIENTLNYNKTFGEAHNLDFLVGYTYQKEDNNRNHILGSEFPNDLISSISAAGSTSTDVSEYEWTLLSYLGRIKYDYAGKYLLSAAIRRDGSSRFGADTKWGVFPSVSAGWRVSEEDFFPQDNFAISELKLRASWGQTGNSQIPNYGSIALLDDANAILGGGVNNGLTPNTSPNPNLSWETTSTTDIGLEASFFNNKLSIVADYYVADTEDMLLNVPVPAQSGFTTSLQNIGKIRNKGFEFAINANNISLGEVSWSSSFNISTNDNEVLALGEGQERIVSNGSRNVTEVGGTLGAHYGYIITGVFGSQAEIDAVPHLSSAKVGSYIYKDVNADGNISSADRDILGDFHPDYTFGLSNTFKYKGFDLNVLLSGVQGVVIHDRLVSTTLYNQEGWANASLDLYLNHFNVNTNPNGIYAAATPRPTDNNHRASNLFVDDGSYVRIRNITLGYSLPESIIEKLSIDKLRLYVTSKNPFTWTKARNFNPEVSGTNPLQGGFFAWGNYPAQKSFVFGVNVTF